MDDDGAMVLDALCQEGRERKKKEGDEEKPWYRSHAIAII